MKQVKLILSMALFALVASPAFSNIVDSYFVDTNVSGLSKTSYTHNLNDDGFVLGSALSGTLSIDVYNEEQRWWDAAVFQVEAFDFDTGSFSFGSSFLNDLEVSALGALNTDGLLDVTIWSTGSFFIGESVLSIITEVPEPATFGLMTIGLLSLVFARRRSQFQA